MKAIAIIPARGGSKRIPGKNIRLFAGLPIIAYSIRAAQQSQLFSRVIVSTDSEAIAQVARHYGAEVPFMRPSELADDYTDTDAVVLHALNWLIKSDDTPNYFCCIYPTAPFVRPDILRRGFELLVAANAATTFAVTTYPYTIFRSLRINDHGRVEMFWPENFSKRSQDLPHAYHDAGQFYWANTERYLIEKRLFSSDSLPVVIPRSLVQDIDTPEDWEVAEQIYLAQQLVAATTAPNAKGV
jgi:pseudaminic acid cytidylyltransferase